ncbi:MAG: SCO family protein [Bryobacterales bacterium]|nr:SCO family protein [Bryobacteraceae bacterium]MDW8131980.1 SCO family protein [Bryobacterales bacterium]
MRASCIAALNLVLVGLATPQLRTPEPLEGVGIEEKIGQKVDLGLEFVAENGYPVRLAQFFGKGRPVILNLIYYSCPTLCNLILNGQTDALREIPGVPGKDFEILTVSIDPAETFDLARRKRAAYLESYGRPAPGWHFLTDYRGNVRKLAEQVGFHYRYDERTRQYAHASAIMILTPEGAVARYLYGVRFKPRDLRLALAEAASSRGGFSVDRMLLFCYRYDPQMRSYVLFATNFMRAGAAASTLLLAVVLIRLWRREARAAREAREKVA